MNEQERKEAEEKAMNLAIFRVYKTDKELADSAKENAPSLTKVLILFGIFIGVLLVCFV